MQANMPTTAVLRPAQPATALIIIAVVALIAIGAIALAEMGTTGEATDVIGPAQAESTVSLEEGEQLTITLPSNLCS